MTEYDKAKHEARMATLARIRAEVDASQTIRLRAPVLCARSLPGWRLIPKCLIN